MKVNLLGILLLLFLSGMSKSYAQSTDDPTFLNYLDTLFEKRDFTQVVDTVTALETPSKYVQFLLANAYYFGGYDQKAYDLLKPIHTKDFDDNMKSRFAYNKAQFCDLIGEFAEGKIYKDSSLLYFPESDQGHTLCSLHSALGTSYFYLGNFLKAIENMKQAASCHEDDGDIESALDVKVNMGAVYIETRNFNQSIQYLKEVLKGYKRDDIDGKYHSFVYLNLGVAYQNVSPDSAEHYLRVGKPYYHQSNFWAYHNSMANNFLENGNLDSAKVHIDKSKGIARKFDQTENLNYSIATECRYMYESGKTNASVACLKEVKPFFLASSSALARKDFLKIFAKARYKKAYLSSELDEYFSLADSIENDIVRIEIDNAVSSLKSRLAQDSVNYLKQESSILSAANSTKNKLLWVIGTLFFVLLAGGYYFIKRILKNKDEISLLNRELNHRVKNNLSFMTSLLQMQGRRQKSPEAQKAIQESETRLKTLSLVHEKLFYKEKDTQIDLQEYLTSVSQYLEQLFSQEGRKLNVRLNVVREKIAAEDAMRIGLIINELVTNSVKYNSVESDLNINVDLQRDTETSTLLINYDDGRYQYDYHKEPDEQQASSSMGKMLIYLLLQQLSPKVRIV